MLERNQALQQYTGWLYTVARNLHDGPLHDDLVQEGYIAMWRAFDTFNPDKGKLDWWLKEAAKYKMKSVVSGGTMTTNQECKSIAGFTTKRGDETRKRITDYTSKNPNASGVEVAKALDISQATLSYQRSKMGTIATASHITTEVSMDAMTDSGWDLEGAGCLDGIEISYHSGEIYEALDVLTEAQRKYVVARFWGNKSTADLYQMFGYDPHSLWRAAKPKLQLRLGNLRELVNA